MKLFPLIAFFTLYLNVSIGQAGEFDWAFDCGNPPNTTDTKTTLASDSEGNFYLSGEFLNETAFGEFNLVSAGGTDIFLTKHEPGGDVLWALSFGAEDYDFVQRIVIDNQGNILMAGFFYGTIVLGEESYTSSGSQDVFLLKLDSQGNILWSEHFGGLMADYISGVATGPSDEVIITGYFYSEMPIGDTVLVSAAGSDLYVAAYDADGSFLWVTHAGGSSSDQVRSISCDDSGSIAISGSFYSDISLGDTLLVTTDPVGAFFAKMNNEGQFIWARQLDGSYLSTEIYSLFDLEGNIFLAGSFSEQVYFGGKTFTAPPFDQDVYIAKFDPEGDLEWAKHGYSIATDQVVSMGIDTFNNLYVAGHFLDTIHFDGLTLDYTLCCGSREVFIVNIGFDGLVRWGQQVSGARANVQSMEVSEQGGLFLSGLFTEDLFLGPFTLSSFESYKTYLTCLQTDVYTLTAQFDLDPRLEVYPNPASDHISILNPDNRYHEYGIYDLSGRALKYGAVSKGRIDISSIPKGTYLIRIRNEEMTRDSKFIKF